MSHQQWFTANCIQMDSDELSKFHSPVSKVVCVGRNYVEHAKELNNPVPGEPLLFIKPNTCLTDIIQAIDLSHLKSPCHYELEIAVLIGDKLTHCPVEQVKSKIAGIGLSLDLTLREIQSELKSKAQPWEKAKCFDGACPVTPFVTWNEKAGSDLNSLNFSLQINGEVRQNANTQSMIFPIETLISYISTHFTLLPGDIILTGTPAGVGLLNAGDLLKLQLNQYVWESQVNG